MVRECGWNSGELGVAAVGVPAGVPRFCAEILLPADAEFAVPTGGQPRDADTITYREVVAGVRPSAATSPTTSWPGITLSGAPEGRPP